MNDNLPYIRQSERADFKSCPRKWHWRWNDGLVPQFPRQDARWFGTMWHLLWATVYTPPSGKDGFTRAITKPSEIHELWDQLAKDSYTTVSGQPYWGDDQEMEWNDACILGHIMIDGQLAEWNLDPAWEIIQPEQRFSALVPFTIEQKLDRWDKLKGAGYVDGSNYIARIVGTYDIPVRDHTDAGSPKVKIVDWKTIAKKQSLKQLNKDDQTGTYLLTAQAFLRAAGLIGKDERVEYMIFSYARKAKPPDEKQLVDDKGRKRNKPQKKHYIEAINKRTGDITVTEKDSLAGMATIAQKMELTVFGEISKNQGSPLFWREVVRRNAANKANQMVRIAEEAEVMSLVRSGDLPILKTPGDHCNWCDFTDLCDIHEDGGDVETFIKDVYKYEDPYADHRRGAKNSKESVR